MKKTDMINNYISITVNNNPISKEHIKDSLTTLVFSDLYFVENIKTILDSLAKLASIYTLYGEKAALVLIRFWETLEDREDLAKCIDDDSELHKKALIKTILQVNAFYKIKINRIES